MEKKNVAVLFHHTVHLLFLLAHCFPSIRFIFIYMCVCKSVFFFDFGIESFSFSAVQQKMKKKKKTISMCSPFDVFFSTNSCVFYFILNSCAFSAATQLKWHSSDFQATRCIWIVHIFCPAYWFYCIFFFSLFMSAIFFALWLLQEQYHCCRQEQYHCVEMCNRKFGLCSCKFRHFNSCSVLNKLVDCMLYM